MTNELYAFLILILALGLCVFYLYISFIISCNKAERVDNFIDSLDDEKKEIIRQYQKVNKVKLTDLVNKNKKNKENKKDVK